jgi:DnaJ-class molecular chaperone
MPMRRVRCPTCKGDGSRPTWTGRRRRCRICRGTGMIR